MERGWHLQPEHWHTRQILGGRTSNSIVWLRGWAKEQNFGGLLDGNAMFRLTRSAYCSHD